MRDVHIAVFHQRPHVAEEEGQNECHDVAAVYVGITHDDGLVVAQFFHIQDALPFFVFFDGYTQSRKHILDLLILVDLVLQGFLYVEDFTSQRQDGLEVPVAALLGGAAGRVALHQEEL